jgi:hypothetical protein
MRNTIFHVQGCNIESDKIYLGRTLPLNKYAVCVLRFSSHIIPYFCLELFHRLWTISASDSEGLF